MFNKRKFLLGATAVSGLLFATGTATAQHAATELRQATSHQEINALLTKYARTLDTGRINDCAALFTNASFSIEGVATVLGKEGVEDLFSAIILYEDGTPRTKHLITNVEIEVAQDGQTARAFSYLTVMQQVSEAPLQPIFSGAYEDEFALIENGWVFTSRIISRPLFGDMSLHLTAPPN